MRHLKIIILGLCLLCGSAAQASADFYASMVAVEDRSTEALRQGLREALVNVLSKASGVPNTLIKQKPSLAFDLQQGDKLASQFSYYSKRIVNDDSSNQQLYLKVSFPENKVVSLLQKGGLTFWAPERPRLNLLVLEKEQGQVDWIDEQKSVFDFWSDMRSQAMLQWGFELQILVTDEAASRLWYTNIAAPNEQPYALLRLSHRDGEQVSGSISLLNVDKTQFLQADTVEQWFEQAISWAGEQLAAIYAVQLLSNDSEIALQFAGVNSYQDYLDVLAMIDNLDIVQHVYVLGMDTQSVNLAVRYTTRAEQLKKSLLNDARVRLDPSSIVNDYQLNLQWLANKK